MNGGFQELTRDAPWLLNFLSMIREMPPMYLGDARVQTLEMFLFGYETARQDLGTTPTWERKSGCSTASRTGCR